MTLVNQDLKGAHFCSSPALFLQFLCSAMSDFNLFTKSTDKKGRPYFSFNLQLLDHEDAFAPQFTTFAQRNLYVSPRAAGPFSADLTDADDVFLAFLSLFFVCIVEAIVTTLLLRTRNGNISTFTFVVKYIIDMYRDLRFLLPIRRRKRKSPSRRRNVQLSATAVFVFCLSNSLEVAVIFLTKPRMKSIINEDMTFRIILPLLPVWGKVYFHSRASMDKPCESLTLVDVNQGTSVNQGATWITACVISNAVDRFPKRFDRSDEPVNFTFVSDVHDYGAEHFLSVGNISANYSSRALFALNDGEPRIMRQWARSRLEENRMKIVHMQVIAYLFSFYRLGTDDTAMGIDRLNSLKPEFSSSLGPEVDVLHFQNKTLRYSSKRYSTTLSGVVPQGRMALRVAHHVLRCSAAVSVTSAKWADVSSTEDLFLRHGLERRRAVVWRERSRSLNWLSLVLLVIALVGFLILLRLILKPSSTTVIAAKLWSNE